MELEQKVEVLTEQLELVREQLRQTQAGLDALLMSGRLAAAAGNGDTIGTQLGLANGNRRVHGVLSVPVPDRSSMPATRQMGEAHETALEGVRLNTGPSEQGSIPGDPRLLEAGRSNGNGSITLKSLAEAITTVHSSREESASESWDGAVRIPLSELAQVLSKNGGGVEPESAAPERPTRSGIPQPSADGPAAIKRQGKASPDIRGRERRQNVPKVPFADLARTLGSIEPAPLGTGRSAAPRKNFRPTGKAPERSEPHHHTGAGGAMDPALPASGPIVRSGVSRPARPRGAVAPKVYPQSPVQTGPSALLYANQMTNLMRWVSGAKRQLGPRIMQEVLDVYRLSGHLPPAVDKAIFQLAQPSMMSDESEYHRSPHDLMIDAVLTLHGIVYGGGRPPSAPAVEFDPSESRVWDESSEQVPAQRCDEDPGGADSQALQGASAAPEAAASVTVPSPRHASPADGPVQGPSQRYQEAMSTYRSALRSAKKLNRELRTGAVESRAAIEGLKPQASEAGPAAEAVRVRETQNRPESNQSWQATNGAGGDPSSPSSSVSLTEQEWRLVETLIPPVKPGGRPSKYDRREILNGIVHQTRTGCSWRTLPMEFPPWKTVHHYFRTWRESGQLGPIMSALEAPKWGGATGSNGSAPHPSQATNSGTANSQGAVGRPRSTV